MFLVREARWGDMPSVEKVLQRAYAQLLPRDYDRDVLSRVLPVITRAQPALVTSGRYYVAEQMGQIIGVGGWSIEIPGENRVEPGRGNIRHLATDPAHLRKGVGQEIIHQSVAAARMAGMKWLHCVSTLTAVPFYTAQGFATAGAVNVPIAPDVSFTAIEMSYTIRR